MVAFKGNGIQGLSTWRSRQVSLVIVCMQNGNRYIYIYNKLVILREVVEIKFSGRIRDLFRFSNLFEFSNLSFFTISLR